MGRGTGLSRSRWRRIRLPSFRSHLGRRLRRLWENSDGRAVVVVDDNEAVVVVVVAVVAVEAVEAVDAVVVAGGFVGVPRLNLARYQHCSS